tara:strand:- start:2732 stop:3055 length:324 start_codon:yes stop_codon:yes gene_type:complete
MITAKGLKQLGFTPLTDFVLQDDGDGPYIAEWKSGSSQPTQTEIEAAEATWNTNYNAKAYARARAAAYPSVADFMEAYTEKEIGGSSTKWDAYVTAYNKVRSDNPKP